MPVDFDRCVALLLGGVVAFPLAGCGVLDELGPYLAPTAAQVVLLEVPLDDLGDAYGQDLPDAGISLTVSLFRVGQSGTAFTEDDLLTGAEVTLFHPTFPEGQGLRVPELDDQKGVYMLTSADVDEKDAATMPLVYHPGTNYIIKIEHNGESYEICQVVPDKTSLLSPRFGDYVRAGGQVDVAWEPAESHSFVGIFDSAGDYVYSNLPEDPAGIYEFITQDPTTTHTVPGSVFQDDDVYVMAAAAMRLADWEEKDKLAYLSPNLNPLGSIFLAGSAAVTAVTTIPLEYVTLTMVGPGESDSVETEEDANVFVDVYAVGLDLVNWFSGETDFDPISDPMSLTVPGGTEFPLYDNGSGDGHFHLSDEDLAVFQYLPGDVYSVVITEEDREISRWMSGEVFDAVSLTEPADGYAYHEATEGEGFELSWDPMVDIISMQVHDYEGQLVYAEDIGLSADDAEGPYSSMVIPEEAFSSGPGLYSVAFVGLERNQSFLDSYGVNLDFSAILSGATAFTAISVMPRYE